MSVANYRKVDFCCMSKCVSTRKKTVFNVSQFHIFNLDAKLYSKFNWNLSLIEKMHFPSSEFQTFWNADAIIIKRRIIWISVVRKKSGSSKGWKNSRRLQMLGNKGLLINFHTICCQPSLTNITCCDCLQSQPID